MKYILITGCAGFIGSNFVRFLLRKKIKYNILGIDKLTYAANKNSIKEFKKNKKFEFIKCDIAKIRKLQKIFLKYNIHHVINFAAETHVDNSINSPNVFIKSNIIGTYNLLQLSRKKWLSESFKLYKNSRYLQISTDEVYGSIKKGKFTEQSQFRPNSPYSSSKTSADLIVRSFNKTYGLNTLISHSSNNFGPYQNKEKLIPTIINNLISKKRIPIYGKGINVRNWTYVDENNKAILKVLFNGKIGESYNIGSNIEMTNLALTKKICKIFKNITKDKFDYLKLIKFVKDRPGHDLRYALNSQKIKKHCNWKYSGNFDIQIKKTILHILNNK